MKKPNRSLLGQSLSCQGFSLLEPLLASVMLAIVTSGTAMMLMSANRVSSKADAVDNIEWEINKDLAAIQRLSRRLTCCSGSCMIPDPSTFSYGSTKACAVNNPDDDRYFFPQLDDPSTANVNEPSAVDTLCGNSNNNTFMAPLEIAIDAKANPSGVSRTTTIRSDHTLEVAYTETTTNQVRRVALIVPPMAFWCP
jgi:type II secretory pathway pseudopilin PulG